MTRQLSVSSCHYLKPCKYEKLTVVCYFKQIQTYYRLRKCEKNIVDALEPFVSSDYFLDDIRGSIPRCASSHSLFIFLTRLFKLRYLYLPMHLSDKT
jgi:hypothetical protein